MKKLKQFTKFDSEAFLEDKKLAIKSIKPTYEYVNGVRSEVATGTTIAITILEDNTTYGEEIGLNTFESFNLKLGANCEAIKQRLKIGQQIKIKDYANLTGVIFGDFQNNLTLTYNGSGVPFATIGAKSND
jgi:hypothetical protein